MSLLSKRLIPAPVQVSVSVPSAPWSLLAHLYQRSVWLEKHTPVFPCFFRDDYKAEEVSRMKGYHLKKACEEQHGEKTAQGFVSFFFSFFSKIVKTHMQHILVKGSKRERKLQLAVVFSSYFLLLSFSSC